MLYAFVAVIVLTLGSAALCGLGAAVAWRGWRGRPRGCAPYCGRCGYVLVGLGTKGRRCPECGAGLAAGDAVRLARRRRSAAQAAAGVGLMFAGLTPLTVALLPEAAPAAVTAVAARPVAAPRMSTWSWGGRAASAPAPRDVQARAPSRSIPDAAGRGGGAAGGEAPADVTVGPVTPLEIDWARSARADIEAHVRGADRRLATAGRLPAPPSPPRPPKSPGLIPAAGGLR